MTRVLILDAEPLSVLARESGPEFAEVHGALEAARRLHRDVIAPAVILAELYRGAGHNHVVDACLSRSSFIDVRDTDRTFARLVGSVLTAANSGSENLADAHTVAAAVEAGGGVVVTVDGDDIERLAGAFQNVAVRTI